jgi:hypothetical protein
MSAKKLTRLPKLTSEVQDRFFSLFKQAIPPGVGLADEVADLLNISPDGAYRRIRGETELTLQEVGILIAKYHVSLDDVFGRQKNTASFTYTKLTDSEDNFVGYITRLYTQLTLLSQFPGSKIYYVADEVPLFYSFGSPKLTEFKLFFWQRSVLNIEKYQKAKFSWGLVPSHIVETAINSHKDYMKIPSIEIWTDETVLTNLKQVKFYYDSGLLNKTDALDLLQEHRDLIQKVLVMAENNRKNVSDKNDTFALYSSEVVLGTNCIYAVMGEQKHSYISFNSINSLTTRNSEFCEETENWLKNLEKRSSLISGIAEKLRFQFFNKMLNTIDTYIDTIARDQLP